MDLIKLENKFNVKLDDVQKAALSSLIDFMTNDERCICLTGEGGAGKTLLISMLYSMLKNKYRIQFVAPTNKAKNVLSIKLPPDSPVCTIHQLLGLTPNLDILEFDAKQMEFDFGFIKTRKCSLDLLVIDEASMINDDLYDLLLSIPEYKKIVFCGDAKQLAPVNQSHISKAFSHNIITLINVYRQKENTIYKVLKYLRKKPLYQFKNVNEDTGNIIIKNNIMEMLKEYSYLFKLSGDFDDKSLVKLITYTNNRITALNTIIRKFIYTDPQEYEEREILTGYDTCICGNASIENSRDYMVLSCETINIHGATGYKLLLDNGCFKQYVSILSKNNAQ
jgi:energy-coupling factor transporter ATP-binding protein EcfA2